MDFCGTRARLLYMGSNLENTVTGFRWVTSGPWNAFRVDSFWLQVARQVGDSGWFGFGLGLERVPGSDGLSRESLNDILGILAIHRLNIGLPSFFFLCFLSGRSPFMG